MTSSRPGATASPPLASQPSERAGLSLLEALFAAAMLAFLVYGLATAYHTAHMAQATAREHQAASLAAATRIEELADLARRSYPEIQGAFVGPDGVRVGWGGFPVLLGLFEIGATTGGTLDLRNALPPAPPDSGLFPPERSTGPAADLDHAGYAVFEALDPYPSDPGARTRWPMRVRASVVVAWRTAGGSPSSVSYATILISPFVIPVPGP